MQSRLLPSAGGSAETTARRAEDQLESTCLISAFHCGSLHNPSNGLHFSDSRTGSPTWQQYPLRPSTDGESPCVGPSFFVLTLICYYRSTCTDSTPSYIGTYHYSTRRYRGLMSTDQMLDSLTDRTIHSHLASLPDDRCCLLHDELAAFQ